MRGGGGGGGRGCMISFMQTQPGIQQGEGSLSEPQMQA